MDESTKYLIRAALGKAKGQIRISLKQNRPLTEAEIADILAWLDEIVNIVEIN